MKGLFVLGTDTGVGKTLVSTALLRTWSTVGRPVAACKPCETGDGDDAVQLLGATQRHFDPALVSPYRFRLPAAPLIAAAHAGQVLDFAVLDAAIAELARDAKMILVEGAGGLLVPWTSTATTAELVSHLGLPVLLVARTGLGTINHTLLTLEALERRNITLLGVVLSQTSPVAGEEEGYTVRYLSDRAPVLGVVPWIATTPLVDRQLECARFIDTDAIWSRVME